MTPPLVLLPPLFTTIVSLLSSYSHLPLTSTPLFLPSSNPSPLLLSPNASLSSLSLKVNHYEVGHDINVTGVWSNNITGVGVVVAVVDDGKDINSYKCVVCL